MDPRFEQFIQERRRHPCAGRTWTSTISWSDFKGRDAKTAGCRSRSSYAVGYAARAVHCASNAKRLLVIGELHWGKDFF